MKIIEPGKPKEKWILQHRCTGWGDTNEGCNALLELEESDLRYKKGYADEKCDLPDNVMFKCPCCRVITFLGINDWPKNYRSLTKYTVDWLYI